MKKVKLLYFIVFLVSILLLMVSSIFFTAQVVKASSAETEVGIIFELDANGGSTVDSTIPKPNPGEGNQGNTGSNFPQTGEKKSLFYSFIGSWILMILFVIILINKKRKRGN
ncbi:LPXTG cell wall anchor domain-containing protein [Carnobacterium gallinarum]|uniref:LPXTG cell wall anchor domain-containing protein n=1 Tax=Carnobacterium gallinarum TaxID=2749 RepID=UPI00054E61C2|nr:LPXTG cell wall anchor domain-containing protein [Carnobacterium gallinarum]